jgi:hypothetical protein
MKLKPRSSWIASRIGWKQLNMPRRKNKSSFPRAEKPSFIPHPKNPTLVPQGTPLKVQKLTWVEMDECQLKGIFYNCDDKYFLGHKYKEKKLFMAIEISYVCY